MIFFGVYGSTMKLVHQGEVHGTKYREIALAGAFGGAMQAIPAVPIELVKVKLQTQVGKHAAAGVALGTERMYKGPVDCIRSIYRHHGLRGAFRGFHATTLRDMTGFATYITTYEYLCDSWSTEGSKDCSVTCLLLAGGIAGTCSWVINIPMDVVKSRMQCDSLTAPRYRGMLDCALKSYRREGCKVFWRGLPVTCLRAFPVNAVTFAVYSLSLRSMEGFLHKT